MSSRILRLGQRPSPPVLRRYPLGARGDEYLPLTCLAKATRFTPASPPASPLAITTPHAPRTTHHSPITSTATCAEDNMGGERVRLYVSGQFLGFKRSKVNQYNHTALVKLQGVETKEETNFYLGKRLAYIYKAKTLKKGSHYRVIFGKVTRAHGSTGVVRSKFRKPLPSNAIGARIRCLLYPSTI